MEILKVAGTSKPKSVAGAMAACLRETKSVEAQAVGAAAINQLVKAIAICRGYMSPAGVDLICIPAFADVRIDDIEKTAMRFIIEPR